MYETIYDLPFVCQLNLPAAALEVYRDAFNRAWLHAEGDPDRYLVAQNAAWRVVREGFQREAATGSWLPKVASIETARAARPRTKPAAEERVAAAL